ncbi:MULTISPECIES: head-tail adaptor protein [unclassified Mesorhizobium]|uniref:phage head completion protein n=1 Tax=unclassified Mesorhizobium TaxID=325217 RepID=UPI00112CBAA2|nr:MULTISPECIES: head-tail adaptor protein [unclassified Mesorhizobium]MCA0025474.1 head-tail adaptor protein [Mesorhizobium sp. B263B1A]TPJ97137.1 head-tail adaptor protein [Mesorhizobium sp. B2-5-12]TPK27196.1 head-tail adaptor protein [Mesorhizobium sp. B2-5-6]
MPSKPSAGSLRERVAFDAREAIDDDYGNTVAGDFSERFQCRAEFRSRGGSEAVVAARLEGRNIFGVYIRSSAQSRQITTDWRMRDVRRGIVYAIDAVDSVSDPAWVYLTVESGVAA